MSVLRSLFIWAVYLSFSTVLVYINTIKAAEKVSYQLPNVTFSVSKDWKLVKDSPENEYQFHSPDGYFNLTAWWWFQDEPLLGYDDILYSGTMSLGGEEALLIHSETADERALEIAFINRKNEKGEIFLFQLVSPKKLTLTNHEWMLDILTRQLFFYQEKANLRGRNPFTKKTLKPYSEPAFTADTQPKSADQLSVQADSVLMGSAWLDQLKEKYDENCQAQPIKKAHDKTHSTVEKTLKTYDVPLQFLIECGDLPIFGVDFPHNPRGGFLDYFRPIYVDVSKVLSYQNFAFLIPEEKLLVQFSLQNNRDLAFTFNELDASVGSLKKLPQTTNNSATKAQIIFDGKSLDSWKSFGFASGSFDKHASKGSSGIRFAIPEKLGWAKTGLIYLDQLVSLPEPGSTSAIEIAVHMDAEVSNTASIALVDPEKKDADPWKSHDLWFHLIKGTSYGVLKSSLRGYQNPGDMAFRWPEGDAVFRFILRADGVMDLRDKAGNLLVSLNIGDHWKDREWALLTYAQVPWKHAAASLTLQKVTLNQIPITPEPHVGAFNSKDFKLFDGTQLAPLWVPLEARKKALVEVSKLENGVLRLLWPEERKTNYVGIYSAEPVIWLDRFDDSSSARITVEMDGGSTKNIDIGFQQSWGQPNNTLGGNAWVASWRRQEDGSYSFQHKAKGKQQVVAEGFSSIPDLMTIVLDPSGVSVEAEGIPADKVPWNQLIDGAGLRMWMYARKPQSGSAGMALKNIGLEYTPGVIKGASKPQYGVEPLPGSVLFDGVMTNDWQGLSRGDVQFESLSNKTSEGLILARREKPPNQNRIALASADPIFSLDYRLEYTGFRTSVEINPDQPGLSGWIYLSGNPNKPYDTTKAGVYIEKIESGPNVGGLNVRFYSGHNYYDFAERTLPKDWVEKWSGQISISLHKHIASVFLDDVKTHSFLNTRIKQGLSAHLVIEPGARFKRKYGAITVRKVTTGWETPDGMDEAMRLTLVDDKDFDPDAFADLMADPGRPGRGE